MSEVEVYRRRPAFLMSGTRRARVEIVSLIDVMFLLVAFFMVATLSMTSQEGIPVALSPAGSAETPPADQNEVVVSIDSSGLFYLGKDLVELEELSRRLASIALSNPNQPLIINADRASLHEKVITLLDTIRHAGLANIVFSVEPQK
jgi:biopolymer transport protein ExbD